MTFRHTNRPGLLLGFIDFFTAGLFFLLYMPLGDEIFVVNVDGYIGSSTKREIEYAEKTGKRVRYLEASVINLCFPKRKGKHG